MNPERKIHRIGIQDVRHLRSALSTSTKPSSLNSLEVFRNFDALHPDASAYLIQALRGLPSVLIVTDPTVATTIARAHDFKDFSTQTVIKRGLTADRGDFVLRREEPSEWQKDRRTMAHTYGASHIEEYEPEIRTVAYNSVDRFATHFKKKIPPVWLKCIALDEISTLVVGQPLEQDLVYKAAKELQQFTRHTALLAATGTLPASHRSEIVMNFLPNYRSLLSQMNEAHLQSPEAGMLGHMLSHFPNRQDEVSDIIKTLVSGVNFIPTQIAFTAWNLAQDKEKQERALADPSYLQSCMWATNLMYPPAPYTGRVVTQTMQIDDAVLKKGSTIIFANAAFGGKKYIKNSGIFDPDRPNLKVLAKETDGNAYIFGSGLHTCPAKHLAPLVVQNTLNALIEKWELGVSDERPIIPVLGSASLVTKSPIPLTLKDRQNPHRILNADISW